MGMWSVSAPATSQANGGPSMTSPSEEYRLIPLTQGQFAKIDLADYKYLSQWKWQARWAACTKSFYAIRCDRSSIPRRTVYMHRDLLCLLWGDKHQGDHINGDSLDNRRSNLRTVWQGHNKKNAKKRSDNSSGYKGVYWMKSMSAWAASVQCDNRRIYLGCFPTPELAYDAYLAAAEVTHGEFMRDAKRRQGVRV